MNNFIQRLSVNGESISLKSSEVTLTLSRPARGRFLVYSENEVVEGSKVDFESGYQGGSITSWFSGYVESSIEIKKNVYRLFCRDLSAVYLQPVPVSIRSATIPMITKELAQQTGLAFSIPDQPYAKKKVPIFSGLNRGVDTINSFEKVFNINDFVWYMQADDSIFVGSHKDSIFNGLDFPIANNVFKTINYMGGTLSLIPGLVPGYSINSKRVLEIVINNELMDVSW